MGEPGVQSEKRRGRARAPLHAPVPPCKGSEIRLRPRRAVVCRCTGCRGRRRKPWPVAYAEANVPDRASAKLQTPRFPSVGVLVLPGW